MSVNVYQLPEITREISLFDLITAENGAIALSTTGTLTINNKIDASQGAGNISLYAAGDMSIQDQIHAGTGHISILTDGRLTQGTVDNTSGYIIAGGTIDIQARSDMFSYTDNKIQSDSNIRIDSDGTLSISSIVSGESVVDSGTDDLDIQASHLRIETKNIKGVQAIMTTDWNYLLIPLLHMLEKQL